jgi:hypothetical protein
MLMNDTTASWTQALPFFPLPGAATSDANALDLIGNVARVQALVGNYLGQCVAFAALCRMVFVVNGGSSTPEK